MCTEFHYREEDRRTRGVGPYSPHTLGSFLPGPRTLRPERLQWLTTSAVNRQAFMRIKMWSLGVGLIAQRIMVTVHLITCPFHVPSATPAYAGFS